MPRFAAEGQVGVDFRDQTWAAMERHQDAVTSLTELLELLPAVPTRPETP